METLLEMLASVDNALTYGRLTLHEARKSDQFILCDVLLDSLKNLELARKIILDKIGH